MATRKPQLRAVKADETSTSKLDVVEAASSGDHRALLVAMRDRIAKTVRNPDCPPRDLASLTKRLADLAKEIEAIDLRAREERGSDDRGTTAADEDFDTSAI